MINYVRLVGAVSILISAQAFAQDEEGEDSIPVEEPAAGDEGGDEGGEEGAPARPAPGGAEAGGTPQVSETHLVQGGDTLWDLCSKYLNSPWYWPKIWSYNPQITNPHWIYPGNELRFYPSDENLPTPVAVSQSMTLGEDATPDGPIDADDLVQTVGNIEVGR